MRMIIPTQRSKEFSLNVDKILSWHKDGKNVSQFFNTLSLFFPEGERFFINSVRYFRGEIEDEHFQKAIRAFIGQEAMHGREHDNLNDAVKHVTRGAKFQEDMVTKLLQFGFKHLPKKHSLAITVALEHMSALMADSLLEAPELIEGADSEFRNIWQWHAYEEVEHKAVAFDVYEEITKDSKVSGYIVRVGWTILATAIFFAIFIPSYINNVARVGGLFDIKGWRAVLKLTVGRKGIFTHAAPLWFDGLKYDFHPWFSHDNRHLLSKYKEVGGEAS